ncbi:MAG: pullulanase-type alpha-1,6-glucosidase [Holophagales bacterium]|nr:pullulanase-type alpha-1,6-glucosidase [Holophagales bacterium]
MLLLALAPAAAMLAMPAVADHTPQPAAVTVAGSLQDELGCPADWQPDCEATQLAYDSADDVWQGVFTVPAGMWEYKAPLNNSWDENYGLGGVLNGDNIPLELAAETDVKLYYSHTTHWITDDVSTRIATAPGSFQDELGCPGDWQPDCLRSWLQDPDGDGTFTFVTDDLPAGDYETKVAISESWDENYGAGGVSNGPNIPFTVAENCQPTEFSFDSATNLLSVAATEGGVSQPGFVTVAGSFQEELGCPGDWQPDCAATHLTFDPADGVWQGDFLVPAGDWEYKAPIDNSWDENYGQNAQLDGANIPLSLAEDTMVRFYYDHGTHWITDNLGSIIATVPGSFQEEIGCPGDWQPDCLRSWLQDPDGDGIYTFSTKQIPPGAYEAKVAIDETWDLNYGLDGVENGPNIPFTVPSACLEVFFLWDSETKVLTITTDADAGPRGNLSLSRAHWVTESTFAWNSVPAQAASQVWLHYAADADLSLSTEGVVGGQALPLTLDPAGLPPAVVEKYPHLAGHAAYTLDAADLAMVPNVLQARLALSAVDAEGAVLDATSVQIPGVLDDLYTYDGELGVVWQGAIPTLRVWAPTARSVRLHRFDGPTGAALVVTPMEYDAATGTWSLRGQPDWKGQYYLYEVEVYAPGTQAVETNLVTDPYSFSLAADSARSQIVDLDDASLRPPGWNGLQKPDLTAPEDTVLYELHVRDFSWNDATVSDANRGTFRAFTETGSNGMQHLKSLADAGLTHVHLLPSFDIATVPERREEQEELDFEALRALSPISEEQQATVAAIEDQDGFNWGYDPWHYTVPEGSYATDPDGGQRILEFREMVQALNQNGLRVVMDVVYNHTNAAGQNPKSVLDRVVPGYYHRLNADGAIEMSTCCANTASEHAMMEKLMIDSVLTWATAYKVDGFRFDLMGHHMKRNMVKLRQALDALEKGPDGVDGSEVYVYGEGWNFGEVADGARGENAIQANMAGTGIGTFNDRIRDAGRGGGPFSGLQEQGFLTGLYVDPNATDQGDAAAQLDRLLLHQDQIRAGLAGSIADYSFVDRNGDTVTAAQVDYNGQPSGYTEDPQEIINYVAAHDNETFFDAVQLKVPLGTSTADRARIQNLGLSLVLFSQGVPFVHAGQDMLRSKSMDRDSFNSGDWFNRLDFTYQETGWGSGLPVASKNLDNWPLFATLLADPALIPAPSDIQDSVAHFREALEIRKSSPLFRLTTGEAVRASVRFLNTGPDQVPGVIALWIEDSVGVDPDRDHLLVVFNTDVETQSLTFPALAGLGFELHPVQRSSADPLVRASSFDMATGTATVPARTAAVFEVASDGPGGGQPCQAGPITLCLGQDGRFEVVLTWRDFDGNEGAGQAVDLGRQDSGLLWFFDEDNLEMLVKVLDACELESFGNFWVSFAATTDVAFTLTVTDTETGAEWRYENPLGEIPRPVIDTRAFDTCG